MYKGTYVNDGFIFGKHNLSKFIFAKVFFDPSVFPGNTAFLFDINRKQAMLKMMVFRLLANQRPETEHARK